MNTSFCILGYRNLYIEIYSAPTTSCIGYMMLIFNLAPRGKRAELEVAPLAYEVSLGPACDLVGPFGDAF